MTDHSIVEATAAANRLIAIRSRRSDGNKRPPTLPHGSEPVAVEFQDIHFTYEDRDVPVLTGMNLKVNPNLIGSSHFRTLEPRG